MKPVPNQPAIITQPTLQSFKLKGCWTALNMGTIEHQLAIIQVPANTNVVADCTKIQAMDTAGAWVLQKLLLRLNQQNTMVDLSSLDTKFRKLLDTINADMTNLSQQENVAQSKSTFTPNFAERIGRNTVDALQQSTEALGFVGETAIAFAKSVAQPKRIRWRAILFNIRSAGFDALPIVGLLSFLLGVVLAYQGGAQLWQYGANIFIADLVGLSMLREFAPLMTAIIIAGRSGSAYAAQIGTMTVTEEIDAMRTIGILPLELLVLPKVIALIIVMPLLTVFSDALGVFGGMLMARQQLDVSFVEFLDRFVKAVSPTAFMTGIGKAPVFAVIIAMVGCFQGFRTKGGADSVGRQTTRGVVQSIFLVIVADALFSVAFSLLDL
jgi:phospholipid/cholesterol/gamma-HCH transport system permease protein